MPRKIKALRGIIYSIYDNESCMARAMGWKRQKLSKITNGIKEPDIQELNEIAIALEKPVGEIAQIFLAAKSPNEQQPRKRRKEEKQA